MRYGGEYAFDRNTSLSEMDYDYREATQKIKELSIEHGIKPNHMLEIFEAGLHHIFYCNKSKKRAA